MNEAGCQRAVLDLLRSEYGVTDARIEGGGKHMQLTFTAPQGAAKIKTTWPRNPIGRDWGVTLDVKTKDLRRMLGGPIKKDLDARVDHPRKEPSVEATALADQIRDKLPSLAAQLAPEKLSSLAAQAVDLQGWMFACYDNKNRSYLRVSFPKSDRDKVGQKSAITEVKSGIWRLSRSPRGPGTHNYGPDRLYVQWSVARMESFGYTPCEARVEGDAVVVHLPAPDSRKALDDRFRTKSPRAPAVAPPPTTAQAASLPKTASGARWIEPPTVDDIRAALATIRRIEAETPYRLVREGTAWVFDPGLARIV